MTEPESASPSSRPGSSLSRPKRAVFGLITLVSATLFVCLCLEVFLRCYVRYNPSFYTGFSTPVPGGTVQYPYGILKFNGFGMPDEEFASVKLKPRIGYFGDSVCAGVGAGYGYRISEILEHDMPGYEHLNFAQIGAGFTTADRPRFLDLVQKFQIDEAIYLMNLNDVLPDVAHGELQKLGKVRAALDWLRGRSYLYTHVRLQVRNQLTRMGYEAHGQTAYELYPRKYDAVFRETAKRIRETDEILRSRGVTLVVIILPYEMQISAEAERTYWKDGVRWEDDLVDRGPQKKLLAGLDGVRCLDAYPAFVDTAHVAASRLENRVGEYYVYDRGDKLDWNHPNREGHRRIAELIERSGILADGRKAQDPPKFHGSDPSTSAPSG